MTHILLVGNPNCGKTTLFNALTGDHQRVGNWPGVTVEKKTGEFTLGTSTIQITDLPGVYTLVSSLNDSSADERIASLEVAQTNADIIVNVIDACHLERHLYLTSQILERGKPTIVVLTMIDLAKQRGIRIDKTALSHQLGCPIVMLQAHKNIGLSELKQAIANPPKTIQTPILSLSTPVQETLQSLEQQLLLQCSNQQLAAYYSRRILEGDTLLLETFLSSTEVFIAAKKLQNTTPTSQNTIHQPQLNDLDILIADARYQYVHAIVTKVQQKPTDASEHFTAKLDRIVLHRFWALPIFFGMMYLMFVSAINVGGAFQDFFDITTNAIFVQGSAQLLQSLHAPAWLIALCADGIGKGINTTLTFIPVIASMFFFLSLLETSGYMARAAFVVDKVMRILGLPGKSFVPMIVGFGCNVPAILAARTLDSERDRILTILMSPFMSCSARLAIYAVFIAAFFPTGGQNIVFSLYLIGIIMAVLTGLLLRKTLLRGQASPLILELPAYHRPSLKRLCKETFLRLRYFITRASKLIIPVCIILGGLNALTIYGNVSSANPHEHSILSLIGAWMTPIFAPMGLQPDNWPATVSLLTGMLAKEVVVGSLNTLYMQMEHITPQAIANFDLWGSLQTALWSIPENFAKLGRTLLHPIKVTTPIGEMSSSVYGIMYRHFDGKIGAYAYLLFILLYIPCVSTMAAIRQETNRKFMWFSIVWSFVVAYASGVLFYQLATITAHPTQTLYWLVSLMLSLMVSLFVLKRMTRLPGEHYAITTS